MKNQNKRTGVAIGIAVVLGVGSATTARADVIVDVSWEGLFTMLTPNGAPLQNTSAPYTYSYDPTWGYGYRTQLSGTMQFNLTAGTGTGQVVPFELYDGFGPAEILHLSLQAIGDGNGGPGTLVLGNMLFYWGGSSAAPASTVWDAAGLFGALGDGADVAEVISGVGATPASDGIRNGSLPIGPAPLATTTWNTTTINCTPWGGNTSDCMNEPVTGALPLIADSIGGSPFVAGPFQGYSPNFDITSMVVTGVACTGNDCVQAVPVPAAIWLLGSGLLGMCGVSFRKRGHSRR